MSRYFGVDKTRPFDSYYFQFWRMPSVDKASQLFGEADSKINDFYAERDRDADWPKVRWFMARCMPAQCREEAMKLAGPLLRPTLESPQGKKLMDCQGGAIAIWQDGKRVNKICICMMADSEEENDLKYNMERCRLKVLSLLDQLKEKKD